MDKILNILNFIEKNFMLLFFVLLAISIGSSYIDTSIGAVVLDQVGLMMSVAVFMISTNISLEDFKFILKKPKAVLVALLSSFILMPLLYWLLGTLFIGDPVFIFGLILIGLSPIAINSSVYAAMLKGNASISLSSGGISMLVTILALPPIAILFSGASIELDTSILYQSALVTLLIPMILGMLVRHFWNEKIKHVTTTFPTLSGIIILTMSIGIGNVYGSEIIFRIYQQPGLFIACCVVFPIAYFLLHIFGKRFLSPQEAIASSFSGVMKNTGITISFALIAGAEKAVIPILLASLGQEIFSILFFRVIQNQQKKITVNVTNNP